MRAIGVSLPSAKQSSSDGRGEPGPWTRNAVLAAYKFTNAYRASDRVSQYLIRHVIYRADLPNTPREVFFRILIFKLFNKIATWELLELTRFDHV
jgi:alpha-glutamyl/putrescinyl thymine pyrophosphorylase clade 1